MLRGREKQPAYARQFKFFSYRTSLGIRRKEFEGSSKLLAKKAWSFRPITPPPKCLRSNLSRGRGYGPYAVHGSIQFVEFREKFVRVHKLTSICLRYRFKQ